MGLQTHDWLSGRQEYHFCGLRILMYINYNTVGGIEYGTATTSVRAGSKVGKGDQIYLGRVIDKERHIFKNQGTRIILFTTLRQTHLA